MIPVVRYSLIAQKMTDDRNKEKSIILRGINNIWLSYQEQLIEDNLHGDYIDGGVDEL